MSLDFVDELLSSPLEIDGEAALLRKIELVTDKSDMEPSPAMRNHIRCSPQLLGKVWSVLQDLPTQMQTLYIEQLIALVCNPAVVN